jgi:hypothetical protein
MRIEGPRLGGTAVGPDRGQQLFLGEDAGRIGGEDAEERVLLGGEGDEAAADGDPAPGRLEDQLTDAAGPVVGVRATAQDGADARPQFRITERLAFPSIVRTNPAEIRLNLTREGSELNASVMSVASYSANGSTERAAPSPTGPPWTSAFRLRRVRVWSAMKSSSSPSARPGSPSARRSDRAASDALVERAFQVKPETQQHSLEVDLPATVLAGHIFGSRAGRRPRSKRVRGGSERGLVAAL